MPPKQINDQRADSTLDALPNAEPTGASALDAIAQEERDENQAIAEAHDAQIQAEADAVRAQLVAGWQVAMRKVGGIVTAAFKDLKPVWTDEEMNDIGAALADCDEYYGWGGVGSLMSHPLAALCAASAPVAMGTYAFIQERKAKRQAEEVARRRGLAGTIDAQSLPPAAPPGDKKATAPANDQPAARVTNMAGAMDSALANDTFQR